MTKSLSFSRAMTQALMLVFVLCALFPLASAQAFTTSSSKAGGENTPIDLKPPSVGSHSSSGGASLTRTIVGLAIVIAVIWGVAWILRQVKSGREVRSSGSSLSSVATLALSPGRSVHLVRAGSDYVLLASAEHGLMPIHRYTEAQALEAGLWNLQSDSSEEAVGGQAPGQPTRALIDMPGQQPSSKVMQRLRQWTVRR